MTDILRRRATAQALALKAHSARIALARCARLSASRCSGVTNGVSAGLAGRRKWTAVKTALLAKATS